MRIVSDTTPSIAFCHAAHVFHFADVLLFCVPLHLGMGQTDRFMHINKGSGWQQMLSWLWNGLFRPKLPELLPADEWTKRHSRFETWVETPFI